MPRIKIAFFLVLALINSSLLYSQRAESMSPTSDPKINNQIIVTTSLAPKFTNKPFKSLKPKSATNAIFTMLKFSKAKVYRKGDLKLDPRETKKAKCFSDLNHNMPLYSLRRPERPKVFGSFEDQFTNNLIKVSANTCGLVYNVYWSNVAGKLTPNEFISTILYTNSEFLNQLFTSRKVGIYTRPAFYYGYDKNIVIHLSK